MNRQIRRVSAAVGVLLLALLVQLNYVQVVKGDAYRNDDRNYRTILTEYSTPRGPIVVDGAAVAESVATSGDLKYLRKYAKPLIYASVTGYYSLTYGREELEDVENGVLSGTDSRLFGRRVADILTGRDPQGGRVELTLSRAAQEQAYKSMQGQRGAVVAIDPTTGAILAAVSTPSYDPNLLSSHNQTKIQKQYAAYTKDPAQPLLNRAFRQTYPPGSVFKVVVAAAGLRSGLTPTSTVPAPDVLKLPGTANATLRNFGGERCGNGKTDSLDHALVISCNTAFAQLGLTVGTDAVKRQAALFGIDDNERTVPIRTVASTVGPIADQPSLAQSCIGQRDVRITPLQGAMISAAVANDGSLMKPYLVKLERAHDLSVISATKPEQLSTVLDPTVDGQLKTMMQDVVARGTGTRARIDDMPGVVVGGKTGTADTGQFEKDGTTPTPPHAWFSGFATLNGEAKIAIAVVIENGGVTGSETTGGEAAAPIAKDVIEAYLKSQAAR